MKELGTFILPVVASLPGSPSTGQVVSHNGILKEYNGSTWHAIVDLEATNTPLHDYHIPNVGAASTSAASDHLHPSCDWNPDDFGYDSWTYPVDFSATSTLAMVSGTIYQARLFLDHITTINKVYLKVQTAGSTLTSGQTFVGLVDASKNLIGTSHVLTGGGELSTAFASTGKKSITLTASGTGLTNLAFGEYGVVVFSVGTTPAALSGITPSAAANGELASAAWKYSSADTGRTTSFPATLGTLTAFSHGFWAAMSS